MIIKTLSRLALGVVLALLCVGCGPLDYYPGLITKKVEGTVTLENSSSDVKPFIVVEKRRKTFLETSTGYLRKITADIVYPGRDGAYSINFDNDVASMKLNFIARGFLKGSFTFRRSIGVYKYRYEVKLKKDPKWKRQFFLLIKPFLSAYITEKRYLMKDRHQLFLGNWINDAEKRF